MTKQRLWTETDIQALGLTTSLEVAASVLTIGRTKAYALARRGEFPVRVHRVGTSYVVPTAGLRAWLGLSEHRVSVPAVPAPRPAGDAEEWGQ